MSISDVSVKRPISVFMILIALSIFGFISLSRLSVDLFPDMEIPVVVVITEYKGAGPKEVEKSVTKIIEGSVGGVNDIKEIISTSREGSSMVMINFNWGAELDPLVSDVREKLDIVKDMLPDEAGSPILLKFSLSMMPIMMLGLKSSGKVDMEALYNLADDKIKTKLEQVPGIANVVIMGGLKKQVHIDVSKNRLQAYNININTINQLLFVENQNVTGGNVYEGVYKYIVRTVGEFKTLEDIGNIVCTISKNGIPVKLRDIAEIKYGYDEEAGIIRIDREEGLVVQLFKESGLNTVQTAKGVKKKLEEISGMLPPGLEFEIFFDSSDDIRRSINGVLQAGIFAIIIAIFILMFFLWNFRTVSIIGISIPISIIVTFITMYALDINLNMISLFGLALGVGMMVDSSIVVLENIFYFRNKGMGRFSAATKGANQVALAITASVLTTIVIFIPFLIVEGYIKEIFWDMAMTVSISLIASLAVSLTVIPMLSSKMISLKQNTYLKPFEERFTGLLTKFDNLYHRLLERALKNKKKVVFGTLGIALFLGAVILGIIGKEFFPKSDQGHFIMNVEFPPGTRVEYTSAMVKKIEDEIAEIVNTDLRVLSVRIKGGGIFAAFMGASDYKATINIGLVPVTQRERGITDIIEEMRQRMRKYPAKIRVREEGGMQMGSGSMFTIEIRGDDLKSQEKLADDIMKAIKDIKGIREPEIDRDDQLPEISLSINRDLASKVGLNALNIANAVKIGFGGQFSGSMKTEEGTDMEIVLRLRPEDRVTLDDIMSLSLPSPMGELVPLASIINSKKSLSPTGINRKESRRILNINADIYDDSTFLEKMRGKGRSINNVVNDVKKAVEEKVFIPRGFNIVYAGAYKDMQESFADLFMAFILAVVLVYAVMASQFESLIAPFIVMFAVPFGAVGSLIINFITGNTFSAVSAIGIVVQVGIVVNNAIVLVDYMNILMRDKTRPDRAASQAGYRRFRPVLMTSLTTILGLMPMALGLSEGAELYSPLALSILGGLSISTIFTLIVVPVSYAAIRNKYPLKLHEDSDDHVHVIKKKKTKKS
ncbi:efflux RND transporter permease subunit [Spirochaetota bacterium]